MAMNSPHQLASDLNKTLKLGLTERPWNLHSPTDTLWWLVPSTEWPAYSHGKLAFSLAKDDGRKHLLGWNDSLLDIDKIFSGFNVEKGYGNVASFVNPALKSRPEQILDPSWTWFSVIEPRGATKFREALALAASSASIYVYVDSSYAHDRQADAVVQHDSLMFQVERTQLRLMLDNKCPLGVLLPVKAVTDFAALAARLGAIDGYHWVDLYVGTHVPKRDVNIAELHKNVLSHFSQWLK